MLTTLRSVYKGGDEKYNHGLYFTLDDGWVIKNSRHASGYGRQSKKKKKRRVCGGEGSIHDENKLRESKIRDLIFDFSSTSFIN